MTMFADLLTRMRWTTGIPCLIGAALLGLSALGLGGSPAAAQTPALSTPADPHVVRDIDRHRRMAQAHAAAADCLASGQSEKVCQEALRQACRGIAVGRYCGMRHEH